MTLIESPLRLSFALSNPTSNEDGSYEILAITSGLGNGWKFLLVLIPIYGIYLAIVAMFKLAKSFGKGVGFGFGLLFLSPIFLLILAFDNSTYSPAY